MTVESILITLLGGSRETVPDARLANVYVLRVARQGTGYSDSVSAAPGNREYHYNAYGSVDFDIPGGGVEIGPADPVPVGSTEIIYVRYKY